MGLFKIFLVEDDPWSGELLKYQLSQNPDYDISLFTTAKACLDNLYKKPDAVCIDFGLPDMTGDKLLQKVQAFDNTIPVIVISAQEDIAVAVNLLKAGARDYIIKGDNTKELLWNAIIKVRENAELRKEVDGLKAQLEQKYTFENTIIGQSPSLRRIFGLIEKAIKSNINVSITGETGTGKEVVAKAIHYNSDRRRKPFVAVNMAAIPVELMESELFGHEKGAFTGAAGKRVGKFEEAQGGTIFLDEIAEMDLNLQSKILRVLQEREIVRVGGTERVKLDIRLITATHKNLAEEVQKGKFREDLYYRILGLPIELPPLRDRGNDVLVLAKHFADEYARENGLKPLALAADAKDKLLRYNFPGNIRELKAIMDLACVLSNEKEITAEDITYTTIKGNEPYTAVEKTLHEYNCDIIQYYLNKYNKNVVQVANKLGIGKSTIYNLIKQKEVKV